jgi:hypothetical protein
MVIGCGNAVERLLFPFYEDFIPVYALEEKSKFCG